MSDIVKRLRWTALHGTQENAIDIMHAAADKIEQLRAALQGMLDDEPGAAQFAIRTLERKP